MFTPRLRMMVLTALACALLALPALADSQARIVRLSDVQGRVQIDKNTGLGFENAFLNLPVIQGTQLRTGENGRAEIEFEDGSTFRLTPNTTVEFSTLGLSDAGKRISVVNLVEGRAYVNWLGKSGDQFALNFSQEKVDLSQAEHFRVAASSTIAGIASFKNDLDVVGPQGTVKVAKKKMVTFDVEDNDRSTEAGDVESDPYDDWDKQSVEYHDQYARNNSTPYGYGFSDMSYYGSYSNVPGYGNLWQPYFTGVGWDPFMDGAWSWYPGCLTTTATGILFRATAGDGNPAGGTRGRVEFITWVPQPRVFILRLRRSARYTLLPSGRAGRCSRIFRRCGW